MRLDSALDLVMVPDSVPKFSYPWLRWEEGSHGRGVLEVVGKDFHFRLSLTGAMVCIYLHVCYVAHGS